MAHRLWTRELDLRLVEAIKQHWGSDVWRADAQRAIEWDVVFRYVNDWPRELCAADLKKRWQENFRKWLPREVPRRATIVNFTELCNCIQGRTYEREGRKQSLWQSPVSTQGEQVLVSPITSPREDARSLEAQVPEYAHQSSDSSTNFMPPQGVVAAEHASHESRISRESSALLDELVKLVKSGSPDIEQKRVKRIRGAPEDSHAKHVQKERSRRRAINEAIGTLYFFSLDS